MGIGGMVDSHDFFHSEAQKEAGRVINQKQDIIYELQDKITELELKLNNEKMTTDWWRKAWLEEYQLRTRKRTFIDWLTGFVG